ncbi:MAG: septum formation initiator family protein [Acidobacteria bacterium]|nr:septum formation initiator family protein [Acidobacteriota bacterium]
MSERNSVGGSKAGSKVTLKAVILLSSVVSIVLLVSFLFSKGGMAELQKSRQRVAALQGDVDRLRAENQTLGGEIASLRKSTLAVERIAREDLGMSREGEIVYVLQENGEVARDGRGQLRRLENRQQIEH